MTLFIGPVLRLQDRSEQRWHVSVLVGTDQQSPRLTYQAYRTYGEKGGAAGETKTIEPKRLLVANEQSKTPTNILRYDIPVELHSRVEQAVQYGVDGEDGNWTFYVPAAQARTLRIAATSCNGFSSNRERREMADPYNRWHDVLDQHADEPFHLLIMAGDQVYADAIWDECTPIAEWAQIESNRKWDRSFNKEMRERVPRFYFDLYARSWGPPVEEGRSQSMRTALASIPTLMMWDDHDIFDGWGSYAEGKLQSPVYDGIYQTARKYFQVFQRHRQPDSAGQNSHDEDGPSDISPSTANLSYAVTLGDLGILVLDLRSERRRDRVLSDQAWKDIKDWLQQRQSEGLRHLFVVSSVPVVHIDLSALESVTQHVDPMDLDDDLRDHWLSPAHKQQRLELIHELFHFASDSGTRVTLLSGDIHVGALGLLERQSDAETGAPEGSIYQIITSPITHPTPAAVMNWFYDWRASATEEIDRKITSRFVPLPGRGDYYVGARHWVSIGYRAEDRRLMLEWRPETKDGGTAPPYRHVIDSAGTEQTQP